MLRSDFLPLPDWPGAGGAGPAAAAVASAARLPQLPATTTVAGETAVYTPLGQDVAREVQQFISQGSGSAALASPQARWLALQAARQAARSERGKEGLSATGGVRSAAAAVGAAASLQPSQQAFLDRIAPWAQQAAQRLGVSLRAVMAHAALESGWGQRPVRDALGQDSLNLFGIKAQGGWTGASTPALTTEYEAGQAVRQTQSFRQYADLDATFGDYVRLLAHSPRYQAALRTGDDVQAFASGLAAGGYATDPDYAQKLVRISRQIPSP